MRSAQYQSLTSLATAEIASISVTVLIAWVAIEVIVTVPITKDTMNFVVRQCKKWVNPGPAYGENGKVEDGSAIRRFVGGAGKWFQQKQVTSDLEKGV